VVWHLLVSHPVVKVQSTKWESMASLEIPTVGSAGNNIAVFLDRDGVINRAMVVDGKPCSPGAIEEVEILPDVPDALRELKSHGYKLIVITNQPDVGRGTQSREALEAIHYDLMGQLPLDDILVCSHTELDHCDCRKPLPGMLRAAARVHGIDLSNSFMVGDRWRDIDAGYNAGCRTILIDYGYSERAPEHAPDLKVKSLREAADWIIRSRQKEPIFREVFVRLARSNLCGRGRQGQHAGDVPPALHQGLYHQSDFDAGYGRYRL
jgi:D-glycero-D-manno-heptose 1,7-bisphosphate phosphatase